MKMLGDDDYLWSYTRGFAELPSPAQVSRAFAVPVGPRSLGTDSAVMLARDATRLLGRFVAASNKNRPHAFISRHPKTLCYVDRYDAPIPGAVDA